MGSKMPIIVIFVVFMRAATGVTTADPSRLFEIGTEHMKLAQLAYTLHLHNHRDELTVDGVIEQRLNLDSGSFVHTAELASRTNTSLRAVAAVLNAVRLPIVPTLEGTAVLDGIGVIRKALEAGYRSMAHAETLREFQFTANPFLNDARGFEVNKACNVTHLFVLRDKKASNVDENMIDEAIKAIDCLVKVGEPEKKLKAEIDDFLSSPHNLTRLLDGISKTRDYLTHFEQLEKLRKQLKFGREEFETLKPLSEIRFSEVEAGFRAVRRFHTSLSNSPTPMSIFQLNGSSWLQNVLNRGESLGILETELAPVIAELSRLKNFETALQYAKWRREELRLLDELDEFLKQSEMFVMWMSQTEEALRWETCVTNLSSAIPSHVDEVERFAKRLSRFERSLRQISQKLGELKVGKLEAEQAARLRTNLKDVKAHLAEMSSTTTTTKTTLTVKHGSSTTTTITPTITPTIVPEVSTDLLEKTLAFARKVHGPFQDIVEIQMENPSIRHFTIKNFHDELAEVTKWISATNLLSSEKCPRSEIENFKMEPLERFDVFRGVVGKLERSDGKVIRAFEQIAVLNPRWNKALFRTSENQSTPSLNLFKSIDSRLIDTFEGVQVLYQMGQIHRLTPKIALILDADSLVRGRIAAISDKVLQFELEHEWRRKFGKVGKQLRELVAQVSNANRLVPSNEEKSIVDLIPVYKTLAESFAFVGNTDVRGLKTLLERMDDSEVNRIIWAMDELKRALSIDWRLGHVRLTRMADALTALQETFDEFYARRSDPETGIAEEWRFVIVFGSAYLCCLVVYLGWMFLEDFVKKKLFGKREEASSNGSESWSGPEQNYTCTDWKYSHVQLQDSRLPLNRTQAGKSTMHQAIDAKDWNLVRRLLDTGALVDPFENGTTPLLRLVQLKESSMVKTFLEHGASLTLPDLEGRKVAGLPVYDQKRNLAAQTRRIIPSGIARNFKILVCGQEEGHTAIRKKIHPSIGSKITWDARNLTPTDLHEFTHIVIPEEFYQRDNILMLDEVHTELWTYVSLPANLMDPGWLDALVADPNFLQNDRHFILTGTKFDGVVYPDSLLTLKTRIHMMRPALLTSVRVTFLETNAETARRMIPVWKSIVEQFGGKVLDKPSKSDRRPYYTLHDGYVGELSSCWILKHSDSKINPIWRSDAKKFTLVPFRFLLTCIAGNQILSSSNQIVPLDFVKKT